MRVGHASQEPPATGATCRRLRPCSIIQAPRKELRAQVCAHTQTYAHTPRRATGRDTPCGRLRTSACRPSTGRCRRHRGVVDQRRLGRRGGRGQPSLGTSARGRGVGTPLAMCTPMCTHLHECTHRHVLAHRRELGCSGGGAFALAHRVSCQLSTCLGACVPQAGGLVAGDVGCWCVAGWR